MIIRRATPADITAMHDVRLAVTQNRLTDLSKVSLRDYEEFLHIGQGWVCETDGAIAGFAIPDARNGTIWALFVHPAYVGRGIGRSLHDAMVNWLFASRHARIRLTTEPGTRAEGFYRQAGWHEVGRTADGEVMFELTRKRSAR